MAHLHEVRDMDTHFVIDPVSRVITNPNSQKNKLMQGDHNSEIYTFEIPKLVEGHDMSLCNQVRIHYNDIASDKANESKDVYTVNDLHIDIVESDTITFSWLISGNATKYAGLLSFRIQFLCIDESGAITYKWHTEVFKGITISDGFDNTEAVVEEYSDTIAEWEARLDALEAGGGVSSWNDLTDKPFYEDEVYLHESYAIPYTNPTAGKMWLIPSAPLLNIGEVYTINYNGVSYDCMAVAAPAGLSNDENAVCLGNMSVAGGENTGEPFVMLVSYYYQRVDIIDLVGSTSVKVEFPKYKRLGTAIIAKQTVEIASNGSSINNLKYDTVMSSNLAPNTRKNVIVEINGVYYKCVLVTTDTGVTITKTGEKDDLIDGKYAFYFGGGMCFCTNDVGVYTVAVYESVDANDFYLTSPNGTKFLITVDNSGNITANEVT